ncbi:hypothetical protein PQX77_005374 [Marasmius sp. AFHP31]|nr:hypothetical protein PQX77_005374 [Marasmius sp. AFHP31]
MSPEELLATLRSYDIPQMLPGQGLQYIHDAQHDVDLFEAVTALSALQSGKFRLKFCEGSLALLQAKVIFVATPANGILQSFTVAMHSPELWEVQLRFWEQQLLESEFSSFPWDSIRYLTYDGSPGIEAFFEALDRGSQLKSITLHGMATVNDGNTIEPYESSGNPAECVSSNISSLSVELSNRVGFFPMLYDLFRRTTSPSLQNLRPTRYYTGKNTPLLAYDLVSRFAVSSSDQNATSQHWL